MINTNFIPIYLNLILGTIAVLVFAYAAKQLIGYLHFLAFYFWFSHTLRGVGILINDGSVLYNKYFNWNVYTEAINLNLIYQIAFFGGIITAFGRGAFGEVKVLNSKSVDGFNTLDKIAATIVAISLTVFLAVGGFNVLAPFRDASITVISPILRFVYPFALVFGAIVAGRGVIIYGLKGEHLTGFFLFVIGVLSSIAVNQRGILIIFLINAGGYIYMAGRRCLAIMLGFFVYILSQTIKSVLFFVYNDIEGNTGSKNLVQYLQSLPYSPDGDGSEVWMIVVEYVKQNGHLYGKSILNSWASILSSDYRNTQGLLTGLDVINSYHDPFTYWNLKFGFNLSSAQELYLNFGYASIPIFFTASYFLGWILKKYKKQLGLGSDPVYSFVMPFGVCAYVLAISAFMWFVMFFSVAILLRFLSSQREVNERSWLG
jgi:hypothetical protein